jgi:Holliday junction resolvase
VPNNAYLRSTKRERLLVNAYRNAGWLSARSAGSKSPVDVWAVNPHTGETHLTQIKTKKGSRDSFKKLIWQKGDTKFFWLSYE